MSFSQVADLHRTPLSKWIPKEFLRDADKPPTRNVSPPALAAIWNGAPIRCGASPLDPRTPLGGLEYNSRS
jgi:hypothetical protein